MTIDHKKLDMFFTFFDHELESWFTADIACCDSCVDEFIATWPLIYQREIDFQTNMIPLDCFYSGSKDLSSLFTEDEFNEYVKEIGCPRCGAPLQANIWPYVLPFDAPGGFEDYILELKDIALTSPFLLLTHPYASCVYEEIRRLSNITQYAKLASHLYRARPHESGKTYTDIDFLEPPKEKANENRYNHSGCPVLYLGTSKETCFYELRQPANGIYVAEAKFETELKTLDIMTPPPEADIQILQALAYSSLISSTDEGEGMHRPQYIFTRFVSDCARMTGFDSIRYPSVRIGSGFNYVILDPQKWKGAITFVDIQHYTLTKA